MQGKICDDSDYHYNENREREIGETYQDRVFQKVKIALLVSCQHWKYVYHGGNVYEKEKPYRYLKQQKIFREHEKNDIKIQ